MIEYRQFRNSDPPHILRLWHECGLGRGAALGISCNEFDEIIFAQPYFDPGGVIVACRDGELVGFIHAGFSVNEPQTWLAKDEGVIGAVMVHPHSRRQGIGRELVHQAENYLHRWGSQKIFAGSSNRRDPFYCGLYGGSQSAGFLESDRAAAPFSPDSDMFRTNDILSSRDLFPTEWQTPLVFESSPFAVGLGCQHSVGNRRLGGGKLVMGGWTHFIFP